MIETHPEVFWKISVETVFTRHGHETTIHCTGCHELPFEHDVSQ